MSPLLVISAAIVLYALWRFLRPFVVRSPLDNIPGPPSTSLLMGNSAQLMNYDNWAFLQELLGTYGPVAKIHGILGARWLHVYDTKALHSILVKDQELYTRSTGGNIALELILGPGLFATQGERHRKQRKLLNPVFSAAHMRNMTPLFYDIVGKLRGAIASGISSGAEEIDIAAWMGRTALELIGQGGLGHSFDPLTQETSDEYTNAVKELLPTFSEIDWVRVVLPFVEYLGPAWFRRKLLDLVPHPMIQQLKVISDVMYKRSVEIFKERKAAMKRGDDSMLGRVGAGKDVMSVMLKANMAAADEDKLPDDELIGQMSSFILAGVDTTSNALSRILHLLCQHPDVQDKLRAELDDARARYGENTPYNELMTLPYLDAVCRETLRLHSPVTVAGREASYDTVLPLSEAIRGVDGSHLTEIAVPKGTFLSLNLQGCNSNKALWGEDALEWKPERWLNPLPGGLEEARVPGIYANLMTFGGGSYSCIGFKFSQLEMKVVLSTLIRDFIFELPDRPIRWNFAGVNYPTMGNSFSARAEMFLKVKHVSE